MENNSIVHVPVEDDDLCILGRYSYHSFPSIYALTSQLSLEKSNINATQQNPNFALYGQGILIAIIDTGIDYRHPAFVHADNTSKIISIWDQTLESGPPPAGFSFGTEYPIQKINLALRNHNPLSIVPSQDEIGHGTMLAGIAAGNTVLAEDFRGVAPDAELIVVKLKQAKQANRRIFGIPADAICYQETDLILGIRFAVETAQRLNRPLAICIAMGSSQEEHEGLGYTSTYLNALSRTPGIAVVVAGGNEGNNRRHAAGTIPRDTFYADFELQVGAADRTFSMELWQTSPHRLMMEIISPTGERVQQLYPSIDECRRISFIFESSVLWINNIILETQSGDQFILLRFENPMEGIWHFRVYDIDRLNIAAVFNAWLPAGDLISGETYFVDSDPYTTLTGPGNARYAITVTAYNQNDNSILPESSRGYTRSGTIKPDFAAPGFELTCPLPNQLYGSATGTGAAAAHTAAVAALVLEWAVLRGNYTTITGRDIGKLLIRGATQQENIIYPNRIWGYGTLNLFDSFQSLR